MNFVSAVIIGVLYVLVGCLLAVPYCLLAGWSNEGFVSVALLSPIFVMVWLVLGGAAGVVDTRYQGRGFFTVRWKAMFRMPDDLSKGPFVAFWLWALYSFTPVITHWISKIFVATGFNTYGAALDSHRYGVPLYGLLAFIGLAMITMAGLFIVGVIEKIQNN